MRGWLVFFTIALSYSPTAAPGLQAQDAPVEEPEEEPAAEPAAFCWWGQALPACRSFVLFELEGAPAS